MYGMKLVVAELASGLLKEHDTKRHALNFQVIMLDDEAIEPRFIKLHSLEIEHHIARDEGRPIAWQMHVYRHRTSRHHIFIFGAEETQIELVFPLIFVIKEHAQSKGALGVDYGELPRTECIESAHDAELTIVVSSEVAEGGEQDLHGETLHPSGQQRNAFLGNYWGSKPANSSLMERLRGESSGRASMVLRSAAKAAGRPEAASP
jgi:hypothetical protein